ncbi:hypothetical protein M1555_04385 [Patescibacteria group bacterium]|nr:hypothetical protein [Patescibacteria group bacterium]
MFDPGPADADFGFGVEDGDNRIDIYYGYHGYPGHGHMVLGDCDDDGELETFYDRDPWGNVNYDSGDFG